MNTPSKARHPTTSQVSNAQGPVPVPAAGSDGLGMLRGWCGQSLQAARQSAALLEDLQRLNMQSFRSWAESLAQAEREADQADGLVALMALPAQLWNRQLDAWMRQFGEGSQHLLEAELQWSEVARTRAQALGLPWWNGNPMTSPARPPLDGKARVDPLAAFGQLQDTWLQWSQRWVDGMTPGGAARH